MKKLVALFLISCSTFAQDSLSVQSIELKSQVFSLSPIAKNVDLVNGLCLGIGHFDNRLVVAQKINGLNIEASPIGLLLPFMLYAPIFKNIEKNNLKNTDWGAKIIVNGLNISSGGFSSNAFVNGINVSTLTQINTLNGFSASAFLLASQRTNGVSIAGIYNYSEKMNGLSIGFVNGSRDLVGMQIGVYNLCYNQMTGMQIGLVNKSNKTKGLQIGLLNINKKRVLPLINF